MSNAVAYLNVDSAASGPNFSAAAVPALNRLITDAAHGVTDPRTGRDDRRVGAVAQVARARRAADGRRRRAGEQPARQRLRLHGLPQFSRASRSRIYRSMARTACTTRSTTTTTGSHASAIRVSQYHVSLVQIWGLMAMRLADADVIPLDYVPYGERISEFARELERRWTGDAAPLARLREAAAELERAASGVQHAA